MWNEEVTNHLQDRRNFIKTAGSATWGVICAVSIVDHAQSAPYLSLPGKQLNVHSVVPPNAEPAPEDLVRSWITPNKFFYVRSHGPTPNLDASTFKVHVTGLVKNEFQLTVDELKERFRSRTIVATMVCAGNRREEHSITKPVEGVQWGIAPIGNAEWSGIPLSDVLRAAGLREGVKHIWFESVDRVEKENRTFAFGASIPIEKALSDSNSGPGALLAYHMNGEALQPHHGFPLRAVVPGYIGARSVKWLGKIVVSDRPNPNYFMSIAYKVAQEKSDALSKVEPIYEFPINSAICKLGEASSPSINVRGYALPSGYTGRMISQVEISSDNGVHWTKAHFCEGAHEYCWRLWEANVPISSSTQQLIARARDSSGLMQPETVNWNFGGYVFNAWHHVSLKKKQD